MTLNLVPFVSVDKMMKLVLQLGITRVLRDLVDHPRFRAGTMTTTLIDQWQTDNEAILDGTGTVNITGAATWTDGAMFGAGTINFNAGLAITGPADKNLAGGRVINLFGTSTWSGATGANTNDFYTGRLADPGRLQRRPHPVGQHAADRRGAEAGRSPLARHWPELSRPSGMSRHPSARLSRHAGHAPGELVHIGETKTAEPRILLIEFSPEHYQETTFASLAASLLSIEGYGIDGAETQLTLSLADRQGNPEIGRAHV
mgnify:CR=1 FL=1